MWSLGEVIKRGSDRDRDVWLMREERVRGMIGQCRFDGNRLDCQRKRSLGRPSIPEVLLSVGILLSIEFPLSIGLLLSVKRVNDELCDFTVTIEDSKSSDALTKSLLRIPWPRGDPAHRVFGESRGGGLSTPVDGQPPVLKMV
jgi:hypothetical protein